MYIIFSTTEIPKVRMEATFGGEIKIIKNKSLGDSKIPSIQNPVTPGRFLLPRAPVIAPSSLIDSWSAKSLSHYLPKGASESYFFKDLFCSRPCTISPKVKISYIQTTSPKPPPLPDALKHEVSQAYD